MPEISMDTQQFPSVRLPKYDVAIKLLQADNTALHP
jgi:hypothetical protein